jgi:hypothetical protein
MWPRNGKWMPWWISGTLMLTLVTLAGCVEVNVVDTTPAATTPNTFVSPLPAGAKDHNLAVLIADLDPPLNYQQLILRRQAVTLLVAVENTGSSTERDVTVRAELSTPDDPDLLITQGASVASIAPGEIQVVRFARLGEIPYHQNYHLEVRVDPVTGENNLSDNQLAFDIQIHRE